MPGSTRVLDCRNVLGVRWLIVRGLLTVELSFAVESADGLSCVKSQSNNKVWPVRDTGIKMDINLVTGALGEGGLRSNVGGRR